MIEIHLYGKLRRFADDRHPASDSVVHVPVREGDTIQRVMERLGIPMEEVGSNVFLNWRYSALTREVKNGDRLAVFPDDMRLLYKWYFEKAGEEEDDQS